MGRVEGNEALTSCYTINMVPASEGGNWGAVFLLWWAGGEHVQLKGLFAALLISCALAQAPPDAQRDSGARRSQLALPPGGPRACDRNFAAHANLC